jgi:hypothetical protein
VEFRLSIELPGKPAPEGELVARVDHGKVISLAFFTDAVTDISPARGLPYLIDLTALGAASKKGKLKNL